MTRIFLEIARRARIEALGVAMPGARLPERVRRIVDGGLVTRISRARLGLLAAACVVTCGAFLAGTPARARQDAGQAGAAAASAQRPKFEVASVKPCDADSQAPAVAGGRGGGGSPSPQWSPGRLTITCQPVKVFIRNAYIAYEDGQTHPEGMLAEMMADSAPIEGLPHWADTFLDSPRYTISAEVPGDASREMMMGPMMQSLLEDRFQLKVHSESSTVPLYDLVVAKGGAKLPEADTPTCRRVNPDNPRGPLLGPESASRCTMQMKSISMDDLASLLRGPLGVNQPVINKTGIEGRFSIWMVWAVDRSAIYAPDMPRDAPDTPTIFEALKEQLGLELVAAKGPIKTLIVDHIEEPTPN